MNITFNGIIREFKDNKPVGKPEKSNSYYDNGLLLGSPNIENVTPIKTKNGYGLSFKDKTGVREQFVRESKDGDIVFFDLTKSSEDHIESTLFNKDFKTSDKLLIRARDILRTFVEISSKDIKPAQQLLNNIQQRIEALHNNKLQKS